MREIEAIYYNEELKKRYLAEKDRFVITSNYIDVQFRKSSEMEYELDKDISNWTVYEIIEYYKLLNMTSYESLMCLNSIFSLYTQFCLENNLVKDNQNHFLECTKEMLTNCINKSILDKIIISKDTLLKWVDELPNPKDQFVLLSLFEYGKSKDFKDIVNSKISDLNKKEKKLTLSNRTVNISNKLISIIDDCITEDKYYCLTGKGTKVMPLLDYGFIIKSYPNQKLGLSDFQRGRNIYIACQRIFEYLGVGYMSPNAVVESGKLHLIKERAMELGITPMELLESDHLSEIEIQFGCKIVKSIYRKKYNEYLS